MRALSSAASSVTAAAEIGAAQNRIRAPRGALAPAVHVKGRGNGYKRAHWASRGGHFGPAGLGGGGGAGILRRSRPAKAPGIGLGPYLSTIENHNQHLTAAVAAPPDRRLVSHSGGGVKDAVYVGVFLEMIKRFSLDAWLTLYFSLTGGAGDTASGVSRPPTSGRRPVGGGAAAPASDFRYLGDCGLGRIACRLRSHESAALGTRRDPLPKRGSRRGQRRSA